MDPNEKFHIQRVDSDAPAFPSNTLTWYQLFESHLDVAGTPRRYFFELLSLLTQDEDDKDRLQWLGSSGGVEDLYRYNQREKRMYVEAFDGKAFDSTNILDFKSIQFTRDNLAYLLDLIPQIQPRYFSIASYNAHRIELCIAIVNFLTPYKRIRTGVCTSYIKQLEVNDHVKIWIRKGTMEFPTDTHTPMILVGPGTGLAPFRSLLQHHVPKSPTILFFGCRSKEKDFLYGRELMSLTDPFILSLAFSRDQERKVYVQHKIKEMSATVWSIISAGGRIYVAGNTQMPKDVREAIVEVVAKENHVTEQEAEQYVSNMEKNKRYQTESW